jgi:hypothetical protein
LLPRGIILFYVVVVTGLLATFGASFSDGH